MHTTGMQKEKRLEPIVQAVDKLSNNRMILPNAGKINAPDQLGRVLRVPLGTGCGGRIRTYDLRVMS